MQFINLAVLSIHSSRLIKLFGHTKVILYNLDISYLKVIQVVQGIQLREDDHVRQFLEAHIQSDIQQISRSSGENVDDCILLLHELINRMKRGIVCSM